MVEREFTFNYQKTFSTKIQKSSIELGSEQAATKKMKNQE